MLQRTLFLFIFLVAVESFSQQNATFNQLQEKDGKSIETVYSISNPDDGSLWMATDHGLFQFNGLELKQLPLPPSFANEEFLGFYKDLQDRLWIRTLSGKISYLYQSKFRHEHNDSICKKLGFQSIIVEIASSSEALYFFSAKDGIKVLRGDSVEKINSGIIKSVVKLREDTFLLAGGQGLFLMEKDSIRQVLEKDFSQAYASTIKIKNELYVSYGNQLFRYINQKLVPFFSTRSKEAEIINLSSLNDTVAVICSRKGAYFLNLNTMQESLFLSDYSVSSFERDREGNYWFSTLRNGVFYAPVLAELSFSVSELSERIISELAIDDLGRVWVGSDNDEVFVLQHDSLINRFDFSSETNTDQITAIKFYDGGHTFIQGKLFLAHLRNGEIQKKMTLGGNDFYIDQLKNLWTASAQLYRYKDFLKNNETTIDYRTTEGKRANAFWLNKNDTMVGSIYGLYKISRGKLLSSSNITDNVSCFSKNYLSTLSGELYRYNHSLNEFQKTAINLKQAPVCLKEFYNYLFAGTKKGLMFINKDQNIFGQFPLFQNLGVYSLEVLNDRLYVGTEKGLYILTWDKIQQLLQGNIKPLIAIDSILLNGIKIQKDKLNNLKYNEREIELYLNGISFLHDCSFEFQLNLKDWQEAVDGNINLYLEEGERLLKIKAINEIGVASELITLPILLNPPYWKSWSFILIVILLTISVGWLLIRTQLAQIKKKSLEKEKQADLKYQALQLEKKTIDLQQKALRLQMNPHFIFNAINTIKGLYAQKEEKKASIYIGHFSQLLRKIVENQNTRITLKEELQAVEHYVEMSRLKFESLTLNIEVDPVIDPQRYLVPNLIIQPFVENAIVHGFQPKSKGLIWILISDFSEEKLQILIQDNGSGLKTSKSSKNKSVSTGISEERLKLFNEQKETSIKIRNRSGKDGVEVELLINKRKVG